MQKLSHTAPYIAYAVATAGMAVLLLLGSSPGAIVARSYRAYNGRAVPGYTEYTYRDVNLSFSVPLSPVTAVEARAKKDSYILFAYPRCPYCRNLLPVLAAVATSEGVTMDYCQVGPISGYIHLQLGYCRTSANQTSGGRLHRTANLAG